MEYRWQNDKNLAISTDADRAILSQLPLEIQRKIYSDFLFKKFLKSFDRFFSLLNPQYIGDDLKKNAYYNWCHFDYQNFMIAILQRLEPIQFQAKKIIYNELDDVNEVVFIEQGMYDIGYEINKKPHLKLRHANKTVIGMFEVCFDKRNLFIYRTFKHCTGYIIRKRAFRELQEDFPSLYHSLKVKEMFNYLYNVRTPLHFYKKQDIEFYDQRADYKQYLSLQDYNKEEMRELVASTLARGAHGASDEVVCMEGIDERVSSYERYLRKVLKHYDTTQDVYEFATQESERLQEENQKLKEVAIERGLDVEAILKGQDVSALGKALEVGLKPLGQPNGEAVFAKSDHQ